MSWPEIIGSVFAIVCLVVAAVATFAPLAGFTEDVGEADANNERFRRTDGE